MAYFALLWKARTIEKYRQNYENEKYNSIMAANTPIPEKSLSQRWRYYRSDTRKRISKIFKRLYPEGSSISHFLLYLKTDLTIPNFILKSVLGFLGGIMLTYLCFLFLVFQLSISLFHATVVSFIIGVLLTLGLAFSNRIRCLVFLLIPQLFSRVGRYTLTCYALVLILTGPAKNTLKNSEILTESMACQQVQIKATVNQIRYSMRKPYNSMGNSINIIIHRLNNVRRQFKAILLKLNRLVLSILEVIQSGFSWLNSLTEICNKRFGTPLERCKKVLNEGIAQCKKRQDQNSNWDCDISDKANIICSNAKRYNVICVYVDYIDGSIIATIKKRLKNYSKRIRNMLYLQIHTHHSYSFSSNTSHSASQVAAGIVTEIRKRADPLLTWLSWSSCVTSLFLLLIIFRAKYYQHMFETRSRFDNRYITKEMRDLDLKRLRQGRDTVLPLNRRERIKYVTTTSFRLVTSEKVYMTRSAVFTAITTFKLLIHMVADYSLFWVLATIRHHGKLQTILPMEAPDSGVNISGTGKMAEMFQSLLNALKTPLEYQQANENCLPNPHPPDLQRYSQIGILIFLLWFFALFEPYGLRLRHVIMGHYRPERAKARAEWLYNHILRTRGGFMKFARRKLHRKYKYCTEEKYTFIKWLETRIPFWWLRSLLGINPKEPHCLLCGTEEHRNDANTRLQRCNSINCLGIYCTSCFVDIGQLCTVCLSPNDYGDLSDVSLEKGSSDESDEESDSKAGSTTQLLDKTTDDINDELLLIIEGKKSNMLQEKRQIFSSIQNEDSTEFSENTPLLYDSGAVFNKQTYISYNEYSSTSNKRAVIRSAFNITSEENKQLDDQEYDKREIFNSNIENKHTCYYVRKFLNLCSGYWHGIKENVTSCSDLINASTKINLKRDNVTKNYKRRKKSKSNSKATTKYRSYERNDDEETRKYRISAFLEEQDWIKRLERKRSKKIRNKRLKVLNEGLRLENLKENYVTETVKNTNFDYNNTVYENFNQNFGNLPKLEKCEVCQEHIPNSLVVNSRNEKTSADITRRMSFYKSIGNDDFDILKNELNQEPNRNFPSSSNTGQTIPIMRKEDNLIQNANIKNGRHTSNSRDVKSENKTVVPSPVAVQFCECLSEAGTKHQQPEEKPQRKLTQKTNITDAEVEAAPVICHCGTQYTTTSDNVKKDKKIIAKVQLEQKEKATKKEMAEDIEAQPSKFRTSNYEDSRPDERKEEISGTSFESSSQMCLLRKLAANENVWSEIYEYTSGISIKSDSLISSSININASITDNTVCSYVCIDKIHDKKFKKPKYAVVTKANQCTTTDRARLCDVSTIIDDWWSPIVERKKIGEVYFEKKAGDFELLNKNARNKRKSRAAATDGKFVTFTSKAQIIPRGTDDILSASRYLLQSQKYYNELFNAKYNGSYMYPNDAVQNLERNHSPNDIHRARKSHRSKRLEECYPSRK
ncbi:uncharacterized protein LOC131845449 [Achroia grisella]|uniref:uncharacterized protein LOC131845449 n=1 Tax=Achroia grisella TaxID=688607 RepID=UPI0027D23CF5|nr:uncharacterized protein LOC131845449 [Achroia grisella]